MDKAIMAANERQIYFTNDDEEIRAYEMREMALMDERARIRFATDEGRKEGAQEERFRTASNFKKLGVSVEIIAQATGLSVEEIERDS